MSTVTEADLRELKDLINQRFNELDRKIDGTRDSLDKKLDVYIAKNDEQLKGIEKRLDSVDNRLNTITFGIFSVVGVSVTGILGIMAKIVFFPNP
jgi:tetrahydromethanopterin S-methyltransferase subunit G